MLLGVRKTHQNCTGMQSGRYSNCSSPHKNQGTFYNNAGLAIRHLVLPTNSRFKSGRFYFQILSIMILAILGHRPHQSPIPLPNYPKELNEDGMVLTIFKNHLKEKNGPIHSSNTKKNIGMSWFFCCSF